MIATYVVSLLLVGLSGALLDMHRRSWRRAQADDTLTPPERRFALSQYRRRMQASGIIGVLGVAVGCEPLIPHEALWFVLYLASILGACLAIVVLAAIDAWSTRQHLARLSSEHLAAQVKLAREMREAHAAEDLAEPARK
jgi:predicted TIM-barrel fold metal-dependent hydrolase